MPYPFEDEGIYEKELSIARYGDAYTTYDLNNNARTSSCLELFDFSEVGMLKISVNDTGCGIEHFRLEKLFQQNSYFDEKHIGTGLGLYITKQLCQKMGGDIRVFSKPNIGSIFTICIPSEVSREVLQRIPSLVDLIRELHGEQLSLIKRGSVLIADDEELSQLILSSYFNKLNVEIVGKAKNGLDAFEKYKHLHESNNRPMIVTMDLTMPVWDGKMASRKIRAYEKEKGLKESILVIISGNCCDSEQKECMDRNGAIHANEFLKKPLKLDDLKQVLQKYA